MALPALFERLMHKQDTLGRWIRVDQFNAALSLLAAGQVTLQELKGFYQMNQDDAFDMDGLSDKYQEPADPVDKMKVLMEIQGTIEIGSVAWDPEAPVPQFNTPAKLRIRLGLDPNE